MGYYRSIFLIPVFCYSHMFLCGRTFVPIAHWYVSENLPRFFYRNFHKVNIASVTNAEIIYRWKILITSYYFSVPLLVIVIIFFYGFKAIAKECLTVNRARG